MDPTPIEGNYILMNRSAYGVCVSAITVWFERGNDPQRGDVVVFSSPEDGTRLVRQLIGLPGDVVETRGEALHTNHRHLTYMPLLDVAPGALPQTTVILPHELWSEALSGRQHTVVVLPGVRALHSFGPIIVSQDCYPMLDNNRDNSYDSHYFGLVPYGNLIARAFHLALSFDPDHLYMPRSAHMGRPLG